MNEEQQNPQNSLESSDTSVVAPDASSLESPATQPLQSPSQQQPQSQKPKKPSRFSRFNVYLLFLVLIVVIVTATIVIIGTQSSRSPDEVSTVISEQELTPEQIEELAKNAVSVGDPAQVINFQADSIFTGQVLVKEDLDVAGTIRVGGTLSLPGITVAGSSSFDDVVINNSLDIVGGTNIQENITVGGSANIAGNTTVGGQLTAASLSADTFEITGDLQITRHIDAGGGTPSRTTGNAAGSGGTTTINGTDTAGTITINTGSGTAAGCLVTVTFAASFNATPHVVVSPVGRGASELNYYVTRSTAGFSLCASSVPPTGRSYSFDYIIIE